MQRQISNSEETSRKRKKLSGDERLIRNRERNRLHARKTRERKKNQTVVLQSRINELLKEGIRLRRLIDERCTAISLLGLAQNDESVAESSTPLLSSSSICSNYYDQLLSENGWLAEQTGSGEMINANTTAQKRVRRSGKYTPEEREKIRRERNRMHAKKTRDRKKYFLEISEKLISEMENEANLLRAYSLSQNLITEEEVIESQLKDKQSRQEIATFRLQSITDDQEGEDGEYSENEEGGTEEVEQESSEENEKNWSGSNDGSHSSNQDSSNSNNNDSLSSKSGGNNSTGVSTTSELTSNTGDNKPDIAGINKIINGRRALSMYQQHQTREPLNPAYQFSSDGSWAAAQIAAAFHEEEMAHANAVRALNAVAFYHGLVQDTSSLEGSASSKSGNIDEKNMYQNNDNSSKKI